MQNLAISNTYYTIIELEKVEKMMQGIKASVYASKCKAQNRDFGINISLHNARVITAFKINSM